MLELMTGSTVDLPDIGIKTNQYSLSLSEATLLLVRINLIILINAYALM